MRQKMAKREREGKLRIKTGIERRKNKNWMGEDDRGGHRRRGGEKERKEEEEMCRVWHGKSSTAFGVKAKTTLEAYWSIFLPRPFQALASAAVTLL